MRPPPASDAPTQTRAATPSWRGHAQSFRYAVRIAWQRNGPQLLIALLALADGLLRLWPFATQFGVSFNNLTRSGGLLQLADLAVFTPVLVAFGLLLMVPGLLLRARIAWVISLLLLMFAVGFNSLWHKHGHLLVLSLLLMGLLTFYWRRFDRSSLAASSLFALLGVGSLLTYAVLGGLWFGAGFTPAIADLPTALYFSVETLSTVGFGDIVPRTLEARMFTVSLIVLGITLFATTLSVVIGPLIGGNIKRIMQGRIAKMNRKNHFVIIGASSLAFSIFQQLQSRGMPVTVIAPFARTLPYPPETDVIVGDASDINLLRSAGVPEAKAVLTLRDDDAENAFAVLAIKELAPHVRTIAAVNDARHLEKIRRVHPDMLFAPQVLASELLVRTLFDEKIDNDLISKQLFPPH
jgi:voltage-gated potassium channel